MTENQLLSVRGVGLCSAVGLDAPSACAAIRARVSRTEESFFIDQSGEPVIAAMVPEAVGNRHGHRRLAPLLTEAIRDCLKSAPPALKGKDPQIPLLIAVDGPGRVDLPADLVDSLNADLAPLWRGTGLKPAEYVIKGSLGFLHALRRAATLLADKAIDAVLVAAADSLVNRRQLRLLEEQGRLKTGENPDGIIPGEAAAAVLVGRPWQKTPSLLSVCGLGLADEPSVAAKKPNLAVGMADAIRRALQESGMTLNQVDFRVGGMTGEQAAFAEGSTSISRILRAPKEKFELWVPAEKLGDVGAALAACMLVVTAVGITKGYAPGSSAVLFATSSGAERGAMIVSAPERNPDVR